LRLLALLIRLEAALVDGVAVVVVVGLLLQEKLVQKSLHSRSGHVEFCFQIVRLVFILTHQVFVAAITLFYEYPLALKSHQNYLRFLKVSNVSQNPIFIQFICVTQLKKKSH
jgi:hypothetical protein